MSSGTSRQQRWTIEQVRELGVTTDVVTAGSVLGIGRTSSYELARCNAFPVPVIAVGGRYRVPVAALVNLLTPDATHANNTDMPTSPA